MLSQDNRRRTALLVLLKEDITAVEVAVTGSLAPLVPTHQAWSVPP
jgi:hypothetical protein